MPPPCVDKPLGLSLSPPPPVGVLGPIFGNLPRGPQWLSQSKLFYLGPGRDWPLNLDPKCQAVFCWQHRLWWKHFAPLLALGSFCGLLYL